MHAVLG